MTNPLAIEKTLHAKFGGIDEYRPAMRLVVVYCPGCQQRHHFTVQVFDGYTARQNRSPEPVWDWNGSLDCPTFSPSLLCYYSVHLCEGEHTPDVCEDPETCASTAHLILNDDWETSGTKVLGHNTPHTRDPAWGNCHSFLRDGIWEFLGDSAHALAGQKVPMEPLPDWLMPKGDD